MNNHLAYNGGSTLISLNSIYWKIDDTAGRKAAGQGNKRRTSGRSTKGQVDYLVAPDDGQTNADRPSDGKTLRSCRKSKQAGINFTVVSFCGLVGSNCQVIASYWKVLADRFVTAFTNAQFWVLLRQKLWSHVDLATAQTSLIVRFFEPWTVCRLYEQLFTEWSVAHPYFSVSEQDLSCCFLRGVLFNFLPASLSG